MSTLAGELREILVAISRSYLTSVFVLGIIGNIVNVIIFSQASLRSNGCSWYFISVSLVHLFVLTFGCLTRIVALSTGFDLTATSLFFCKFRVYFFVGGIALSRHFLCLISIDRWMVTSSSAWLRRQSSPRIVRRLIIVSTIPWLLFNLHAPIGFHHEVNGCVPNSGTIYLLFYTITNLFVALVPLTILTIFTTITIRNVTNKRPVGRQSRAVATVHPTAVIGGNAAAGIRPSAPPAVCHYQRHRNQNAQLMRLNLTQVAVFILLNSPNAMYALYALITRSGKKSSDQLAIDSFMNSIALNLLYAHCAVCWTSLKKRFLFPVFSQNFDGD
jgi:hypothetical protein